MLKTRLILAFLRFLSWLPLRWQRALGTLVGRLMWALGSQMAHITRRNLKLCFPQMPRAERDTLARESVIETCRTICEAGAVWGWPTEKLAPRIRVRNRELLEEARQEGKGVIVVGPHLGNWEVLGLWLSLEDYGDTVQMYQAPRNAALGEAILAARSRGGAQMVPTDPKGVARVLKALKQGAVTGILPDQVPPPSGGDYSPFFGRPALTMTLLSRLIARTGCRAVLGYTRRYSGETEAEEGFEIVFLPVNEALYSDDPATSLRGLNASIEAAVRQDMSLYQWEYKRFKRQPDGQRLYD